MVIPVDNRILGIDAFHQLAAELSAADELITELVAENEDLRSRLALGGRDPRRSRRTGRRPDRHLHRVAGNPRWTPGGLNRLRRAASERWRLAQSSPSRRPGGLPTRPDPRKAPACISVPSAKQGG
jgi:hypothetical protein